MLDASRGTTTETYSLDDIFRVKSANDWIAESRRRPVPKMLFGEMWLEGELAIMFADTGTGKSLLAVQIAEALARGRSIEPIKMTAPPKRVLYLDFELTDKQFEMRYAAEHSPEKDKYLKKHYRFSKNMDRVEINMNAEVPDGFASFDDFLHDAISRLCREKKAEVLIIDNLTYLRRSNESMREAVPLMKRLNRLKKELGLSILVLAHTPKRALIRPITVNDLQGSKILSNFADNIFAIGQSRLCSNGRYIKQIKPRSTELVYDSSHLPSFTITRIGGNFLGFRFDNFTSEARLLVDGLEHAEWERIRQMKQMSEEGISIRSIAEHFDTSKTTVHRLMQMWPSDVLAAAHNGNNDAASEPEPEVNWFEHQLCGTDCTICKGQYWDLDSYTGYLSEDGCTSKCPDDCTERHLHTFSVNKDHSCSRNFRPSLLDVEGALDFDGITLECCCGHCTGKSLKKCRCCNCDECCDADKCCVHNKEWRLHLIALEQQTAGETDLDGNIADNGETEWVITGKEMDRVPSDETAASDDQPAASVPTRKNPESRRGWLIWYELIEGNHVRWEKSDRRLPLGQILKPKEPEPDEMLWELPRRRWPRIYYGENRQGDLFRITQKGDTYIALLKRHFER